MKKIIAVTMMMVVIVLTGTFCHAESANEEIVKFCEKFDVDVVECYDGSAAMYITVNDTLEHVIALYTDGLSDDTVDIKVFRGGRCLGGELVGGTYTASIYDYEYELEAIVYNLYMIEAAEVDYAAGRVTEDYLNSTIFKYRMTVNG